MTVGYLQRFGQNAKKYSNLQKIYKKLKTKITILLHVEIFYGITIRLKS